MQTTDIAWKKEQNEGCTMYYYSVSTRLILTTKIFEFLMAQQIGGTFWYYKLLYLNIFFISFIKTRPEAVKVLASAIWGRKFEVVWSKNVINIFFMNCCKDQNLKLWAKSVHIYRSYGHFQKCGQFPKRIYYINFERWCASDFWWNFKSKVFQGLGVPSYTCGFMWFLIWWF